MISFWVWWALLVLLGQVFAPIARRLFPGFPDHGLGLARPLAIVSLGYLSWLAASLGLAPSQARILSLIVLVALAGAALRGSPRASRREILGAEAVFGLSFAGFALLRSLEPSIFGAEKYMDFAFFNACLTAERIPPEDPWLAGAPINYYYFGYFTFANLARLSGVAPEIAYNLSLATVGAVLFHGVTSIGRALGGSTAFALLGGFAAAVLGNLDGALQLFLEGRTIAEFDYWRSSRVVPNTINEFPFFSLLHGDLHPHVSGLIVLVPVLAIGVAAWQDGARGAAPLAAHLLEPFRVAMLLVLVAAVSLGNPWDLPVVFAFLGLIAASRLWSRRRAILPLGLAGLGLGGLFLGATLLSLPFALHFEAPLRGVGKVEATTAMRDFLIVFGALGLAPAFWLIEALRRDLPRRPELRELLLAAAAFLLVGFFVVTHNAVLVLTASVLAAALVHLVLRPGDESAPALVLVATAALALLACEIVFVRDSYGQALHRMNTVFKLYFQAWVLLAAAVSWFAASVAQPGRARVALLVVVVICTLAYPVATVAQRVPRAAFTLDGWLELERDHPDDAAAIRWLRDHATARPVILEATGNPYSYFARVSANTGLPTVLGWANHEAVWRGDDARIQRAGRDVARLYEGTNPDETVRLLRRHRVRFVFVGELERATYPAPGLEKFGRHEERFREVFRSGTTAVYEVL